jgi:uncharacterized iron-regulated membrane protein
MSVRGWLATLHGWLGATTALFVVLIAGSGVLLAFMSELFLLQYGDVLRARAPAPAAAYADLDRLVAGALQGHGRPFEVAGVLMPHTRVPGIETALVYGLPAGEQDFEQLRMLSVDPWSGAAQGEFRLDDAFAHQLIHFHHQLYAGTLGDVFVSSLGLLLVAFVLSGLWLWWPRRGAAWRKAARPTVRGPARRVLHSLHGWAGVWAALAIVVSGLTGTATAQPGWFGPLLAPLPADVPPAALARDACSGHVTLAQAAAVAAAPYPQHRLASALLPHAAGGAYRFSLRNANSLDRLEGDLIVFVGARCGTVLATVDAQQAGPATRLHAMMHSLHGGYTFGPLLGDALVIATGLLLLGLAGTGVYVFFASTLRRRAPLPAGELNAPVARAPRARTVGREIALAFVVPLIAMTALSALIGWMLDV